MHLRHNLIVTPAVAERSRAYETLLGMEAVTELITSLPPSAIYAVIGFLVFVEAAVFIGFVFPGETAIFLGGFMASTGHLDFWLLSLVVVVCAIIGDTVGFEVGRLIGPRILRWGPIARHGQRVERGRDLLRRRGGPAVLLGRFTAFFRAVMPALAGLSRMHYPTFLFWNASGAVVWGVGSCIIGYIAGESYERVATMIGTASTVVIAIVIIGSIAGLITYRRLQT